MFERRFSLFNLLGFEVWIDASWLVLVVLITWSLAVGFFPSYFPGLPDNLYWLMGGAGALGIFGSIVLHELAHSLVARHYGVPIKGITLFIFGGVAEMSDEPPSPRGELLMAGAGPLTSILLSALSYLIYILLKSAGALKPIIGVTLYLSLVNLLLAGFNLLPGYPLDGGRMLRSLLWAWKDNLRWATNISSQIGSFFGTALILLGLANVLLGSFVPGMWWFLIGLFLRNAARMSYQQLLIKQYLEGEPVQRFMVLNPITVPSSLSIERLVEDYIYRYHFKMFPVMEEERLLGCISVDEVKELPRREWSSHTVGELASPCTEENTISPSDDAMEALKLMNRTGRSRLLVVEENRLKGLIALKDLMRFLSLKLDLEE